VEVDDVAVGEGGEKVMWMPCCPIFQSSGWGMGVKGVRREMLRCQLY
jgi:hypothetical protein